jgi:hypothetical protein
MNSSKSALKLLITLLFVTYSAALVQNTQKLQQCASTLELATDITKALQATFWGGFNYKQGETWTDANCYESINTLMLTLNVTTWSLINEVSTLGLLGAADLGDWDHFFQGSYDDAQWVILYYYSVADYLKANGRDNSHFMGSAQGIYDYVSAQWDDTCGGGLWWSGAHDYKNAVTNELYLLTSANGYLRNGNQTYLENAKKTWNWLLNSGMRNSDGLFNDGLDTSTCKNNGQPTWTYNQAVVSAGLGNLGKILNDTSLFDQAEISLDATIAKMTVNGILKENCDNAASAAGQCNHDQQMFKGAFTKHLMYYLDAANDPQRTAKYKDFLNAQLSAVFHYGKNAQDIIGSVWYAPDQGGSVFTPETTGAGLAAIIAAAKYGDCDNL